MTALRCKMQRQEAFPAACGCHQGCCWHSCEQQPHCIDMPADGCPVEWCVPKAIVGCSCHRAGCHQQPDKLQVGMRFQQRVVQCIPFTLVRARHQSSWAGRRRQQAPHSLHISCMRCLAQLLSCSIHCTAAEQVGSIVSGCQVAGELHSCLSGRPSGGRRRLSYQPEPDMQLTTRLPPNLLPSGLAARQRLVGPAVVPPGAASLSEPPACLLGALGACCATDQSTETPRGWCSNTNIAARWPPPAHERQARR